MPLQGICIPKVYGDLQENIISNLDVYNTINCTSTALLEYINGWFSC